MEGNNDPAVAKAAFRLAKFALDNSKPITLVDPFAPAVSQKFPLATSVFDINKFTNASEEFDIAGVDSISFQSEVSIPSNLLAYRYLMEAIGRNTTIKWLFMHPKITPEQWEFIIKALKVNNSITMIHFGASSLAQIGKALKVHEVLVECAMALPFTLPDEEIEELASALTASKSLTSFSLRGPLTRSAVPSGKVLPIFKALKEHRGIVKCKFDALAFSTDTSSTLASMIRYNEGLKYLTINYCDIDPLTDSLYDILKLNTSITELDLTLSNFTPEHMTKILQIFKENTSITSLVLDGINLSHNTVTQELDNVLKANTLKKLSLNDCHFYFDEIVTGLAKNTSLTWLSLAKNTVKGWKLTPFLKKSKVQHLILNDCKHLGDCTIFEGIRDNKSLTTLKMQNVNLQEQALNSLAMTLDLNTTLRVLHIKRDTPTSMPMRPVLTALARNKNLRVLRIDKIKEQYHPEWDFAREVLKGNNSLCILTINGESDPVLDSQLRANRDRFNGVTVFLKLMVQRPDVFLDVFPMEIWTKIISYMEGIDIRTIFSVE